jgi:general secretion pathway protein D
VASFGLADRLNVDPQGNALVLRGYPDEAVRIEHALAVIDRPNILEYRQYFAGSAAAQIAELAQRRGWGTVETIDSTPIGPTQPSSPPGAPRGAQAQQIPGLMNQQSSGGGPVMIVDTSRGIIIYYGTPSQHQQLAGLIKTLDTEREQVIITAYKVKNVSSDDVAGLIAAMIGGQSGGGSSGSPFLPNQSGANRNRGTQSGSNSLNPLGGGNLGGQSGSGRTSGGPRPGGAGISATGISPFGNAEVMIISDRSNNQVLVRAPAKQQDDFAKLIAKIDQRRPQVYIEVQIVAVSASDDFRLAFEVQGINANGTGGAVNTNFGLGKLSSGTGTSATDNFLVRKNVVSTLGGITAAIIKSDQVPIVLNALRTDTETRILSSPQLLVDDNENAEIVSVEEQPTSSVSQGTSTTQTSFQGFEKAGTTLNVTPSISEGGYMRLSYYVELSNFAGQGLNGLPPARHTRNVSSESVTIPGDTTIVVGGIRVDSKTNTVARVPLLGDIPILGYLFRDTSITKSNTRLYVFITPRIMRDPNFRDLTLLTKGPQAESGLGPDVPDLKPAFIEMIEAAPETPADQSGGRKPHGGT